MKNDFQQLQIITLHIIVTKSLKRKRIVEKRLLDELPYQLYILTKTFIDPLKIDKRKVFKPCHSLMLREHSAILLTCLEIAIILSTFSGLFQQQQKKKTGKCVDATLDSEKR